MGKWGCWTPHEIYVWLRAWNSPVRNTIFRGEGLHSNDAWQEQSTAYPPRDTHGLSVRWGRVYDPKQARTPQLRWSGRLISALYPPSCCIIKTTTNSHLRTTVLMIMTPPHLDLCKYLKYMNPALSGQSLQSRALIRHSAVILFLPHIHFIRTIKLSFFSVCVYEIFFVAFCDYSIIKGEGLKYWFKNSLKLNKNQRQWRIGGCWTGGSVSVSVALPSRRPGGPDDEGPAFPSH